MVEFVKQCSYQTTGRTNLSQEVFEEIFLDIDVTLNSQSLMFVEEDIQMPVLKPNTLLHGHPLLLLEEDLALREKHNMLHLPKEMQISIGNIVLIKGNKNHRMKRNIKIVNR